MATGLYQNGQLIAALGCSGPTTRLGFKGLAQLEENLKKTAETINQLLEVQRINPHSYMHEYSCGGGCILLSNDRQTIQIPLLQYS